MTKKDELIRKILYNKANNQLSITLPRKQLKFLDKDIKPKKIKIKILEAWM